MPGFARRFPGLRAGQYFEIGTPWRGSNLPPTMAARTFVTPSETLPDEGYYLQAVKGRRAGWGNGTAVIMCNCIDAALKFGHVLSGVKAPCKHARGLRELLRKPAYAREE